MTRVAMRRQRPRIPRSLHPQPAACISRVVVVGSRLCVAEDGADVGGVGDEAAFQREHRAHKR